MPTWKLAQKWCCDLLRLLAQKISRGIHSCKPASLNRLIMVDHATMCRHTTHTNLDPMMVERATMRMYCLCSCSRLMTHFWISLMVVKQDCGSSTTMLALGSSTVPAYTTWHPHASAGNRGKRVKSAWHLHASVGNRGKRVKSAWHLHASAGNRGKGVKSAWDLHAFVGNRGKRVKSAWHLHASVGNRGKRVKSAWHLHASAGNRGKGGQISLRLARLCRQ